MTNEDFDTDYEEESGDLDDDFDPLFGEIAPGAQTDGTLVEDLGWAGMRFAEQFGIESLVGVRGFSNENDYYRWMQAASGSPLSDWYGVQLRLYECWRLEPLEGSFCYIAWSDVVDSDTLFSRPVDVYCLRHVAWSAAISRRTFNCARTRSYCTAAHIKTNPSVPVSPEIMSDVQSDGLLLTGIRPGAEEETVLDWPTPNLDTALELVVASKSAGVHTIHLWECGIGISLDALSESDIQRLRKIDRHYGGDMMLSDLAREAGVIDV